MPVHDMQFFFACANIRMIFLLEVSKILLLCSQPQKNKLRRYPSEYIEIFLKYWCLPKVYSLLTDQKYLGSIKRSHTSNARRNFGNLDNLVVGLRTYNLRLEEQFPLWGFRRYPCFVIKLPNANRERENK